MNGNGMGRIAEHRDSRPKHLGRIAEHRGSSPKYLTPWVAWLAALAGSVALLCCAGWIAPRLPLFPVFAFIAGFTAVSGESLFVSLLVPHALPRMLPWLAFPLAALVVVRMTGSTGLLAAATVTAALLAAGTLTGSVVGSAIEHPGHIGFVAVASSLADVASVYSPAGVTAAVVRSPALLSVLSLPWPMLGTPQFESFLGIGEVLFSSLYLAASRGNGLSVRRTLLALCGGFVLTLFALLLFELDIPALPFLGAAVVLAQPRTRRPAEADRRRGLVGMALLLLIFFGWMLLPYL